MLSVVIPTRNSERALVPTLAMLVPGVMASAVREVIIADGGSSDATREVADFAGCALHRLRRPARHRGCARRSPAARAPWLMFLRPGAILDPTWVAEIARFVEDAGRCGGRRPGGRVPPLARRDATARGR